MFIQQSLVRMFAVQQYLQTQVWSSLRSWEGNTPCPTFRKLWKNGEDKGKLNYWMALKLFQSRP